MLKLLSLFALVASAFADTDRAICPVALTNITDLSAAPALDILNGQKLYFSSKTAVEA